MGGTRCHRARACRHQVPLATAPRRKAPSRAHSSGPLLPAAAEPDTFVPGPVRAVEEPGGPLRRAPAREGAGAEGAGEERNGAERCGAVRSSSPHREGVEATGVGGRREEAAHRRGSPAARERPRRPRRGWRGLGAVRGAAWQLSRRWGGGGGGPRPPPWPPARPARGRRRLSALRGLGVPAVAGAVQSGRESRTAQWFAVRHHSSSGLCPAELRCVPCGLLYAAPGLPRHRKARSRQVPQRALPLAGGGGRLPPGERLPPRAEAEAG